MACHFSRDDICCNNIRDRYCVAFLPSYKHTYSVCSVKLIGMMCRIKVERKEEGGSGEDHHQ